MSNVIYAGLRNPARDQAIHDALKCNSVAKVAELFVRSASAVRAAGRRIDALSSFVLTLEGGGQAHRHRHNSGQIIPACSAWSLPALLRHLPQPRPAALGDDRRRESHTHH